ncbi:unnamed protein product [Caenorhabditis sp. 36 PRJEB53466]|nr:unnamed protein product [Caenorhabditis sp. 36 PRJEB53466]
MSAAKTNGEENTTLMDGEREKAEVETFAQFLFNRKNGTVLGRTGKSWFQITVFYIIFYIILSAFFVGCLAIFLKTLDPKVPRFYGKGTIIGANPGVGYQPWLKENPDSTIIKFNLQDPKSWAPYVSQLDDYLSKYNNTEDTRACGPSDNNGALETDPDAAPCRFDLGIFDKANCGPKDQYGFKSGKPCVIVSLNRLIGWRPVDYEAGSVPEEVKGRYKKGSIAVNCEGANSFDKEHLGKLKYLPESGIDGRYYPYVFTPSYQQPIAMVKFETIPRNKLVIVECRAYALNIEHDITTRLGMVYFEMLVEDKVPAAAPAA